MNMRSIKIVSWRMQKMIKTMIEILKDWINNILPIEDDQELTEDEILFVYGDD